MTDPNEWNRKIIAEFRANDGKVGGPFAGATLLLLTTTGAKSGKQHTTPLMCTIESDQFIVYASKAGAPTNPAWYHNLLANPRVTVEVGTEQFEAIATEVTGAERDRRWKENVARNPGFGEYEKQTTRVIPVISLRRAVRP